MLIIGTASFSGGARPTEFSIRSRSVLRPKRAVELCSICNVSSLPWDKRRREVFRSKRKFLICGNCNKHLLDAPRQIEWVGLRFRLIEKSEIPADLSIGWTPTPVATLPRLRQIYSVLLLAKERQELRQKEIYWMPDEIAKKILKLPDMVAAIVQKTFVVRGDDFKVADDEALVRIRELLESIDPDIIDRMRQRPHLERK